MTTAEQTIYVENTPPGPRAKADANTVPGWGADLDHANRPAYPMERTPPRLENVHWEQPSPQPITVEVLKSTERPGISPVFGSTLPPRGLSGVVRRLAFRASENDLRRWLLLMLADRINVIEGLIEDLSSGHVPNLLGEMGARAELRHNSAALARKLVLLAALGGLALYIGRRLR